MFNDTVPQVLTNLGLPGLVIFAMAFVIRRQYLDNKSLQDKFDVLQEARRVDAKDTTDKVTQPLTSISQTMNLIYDKLSTDNKREH